jgi:hypothetical protein
VTVATRRPVLLRCESVASRRQLGRNARGWGSLTASPLAAATRAQLKGPRGVGEASRFIPPVERLCRRAGNYGGASGSFTDFTASTAMEHPSRPQSLRA